MDLGPCLLLTEGQAIAFGLWCELPNGTLCRAYPATQRGAAVTEHRAICKASGSLNVELTSTASLCLITITHAMDA